MYLALQYDLVDDYLDRRGEYRDEHLALARAARERGELALAGAFTDPADRALLVWSTDDRTVVEALRRGRPVRPQRPGHPLDRPGVERRHRRVIQVAMRPLQGP